MARAEQAAAEAERAALDRLNVMRSRRKRTLIGIFLLICFALAAVAAAILATRQTQRAQEETQRADAFINLVSSDPAGLRAMNKICSEAIGVTSTIATTTDKDEFDRFVDRYWELYYGPMYIIEIHQAKKSDLRESEIEKSMIRFGQELEAIGKEQTPLPHSKLCQQARDVKNECTAYLKLNIAAPEPC